MTCLYDLFLRGGPWMWPLLLLSVAAVAIVAERVLLLWRERVDAEDAMEQLKAALSGGGRPVMAEAGEKLGGGLGALVQTAVDHADETRADLEQALAVAGNAALGHLEGPLNALRAVAEVAPLLGFLGTVTGMIKAFDAIVARGSADPTVIAGGISEAMITTAAGLTIAIPAFLCWTILSSRIDRIQAAMERVAHGLVRMLAGGGDPA